MAARDIARSLSFAARELLISHVPTGSMPIINNGSRDDALRRVVAKALEAKALIAAGGGCGKKNPTHTVLTELGREVSAAVLADYADALIRAGRLDPDRAFDVGTRLQRAAAGLTGS